MLLTRSFLAPSAVQQLQFISSSSLAQRISSPMSTNPPPAKCPILQNRTAVPGELESGTRDNN